MTFEDNAPIPDELKQMLLSAALKAQASCLKVFDAAEADDLVTVSICLMKLQLEVIEMTDSVKEEAVKRLVLIRPDFKLPESFD